MNKAEKSGLSIVLVAIFSGILLQQNLSIEGYISLIMLFLIGVMLFRFGED